MKRIINSGDCEHCLGHVVYECDRFKVEMTKRGMVYELYGGCSQLEAAESYHKWMEVRDQKKESA